MKLRNMLYIYICGKLFQMQLICSPSIVDIYSLLTWKHTIKGTGKIDIYVFDHENTNCKEIHEFFPIFSNFSSYINGSVWEWNVEKVTILQFFFAISVDNLNEFLQNCPYVYTRH